MIIGGSFGDLSSMQTEIWELDNEVYNLIQPNLPDDEYSTGMALFEVDANFCKKNKGKSSRLRTLFGFDKSRYLPVQINVKRLVA